MMSADRLLAHRTIDEETGCWLWTASKNNVGYGHVHIDGQTRLVHRVSYRTFVGEIPDGLVLDHLCRVRHCFAPQHLEPVTQAENVRRGVRSIRTHCPNGHEFTEANTYLYGPRANRHCRTCNRDRHRAAYHRSKAVAS